MINDFGGFYASACAVDCFLLFELNTVITVTGGRVL